MEHFPGVRTRAQSDASVDRFGADIEANGFGFFALERRDDGAFLGFVGLEATEPETALRRRARDRLAPRPPRLG